MWMRMSKGLFVESSDGDAWQELKAVLPHALPKKEVIIYGFYERQPNGP